MCTKAFSYVINNMKIGNNILYRTLSTKPELNIDYICDLKNINTISDNITRRKGVGNIQTVHELYNKIKDKQTNDTELEELKKQFYSEVKKIPNDTHPEVINYGKEPKLVKFIGEKQKFDFKPREFHEIAKILNLIRTEQLGNVSGNRSYYFLGILAELEQALIQYTVQKLVKKGFELISVPDIVELRTIENCGMTVKGDRTQVNFKINKNFIFLLNIFRFTV